MSFSVFTSCAINYLPKARSLAESLKRHAPDAVLTLCLNDVPPAWLDLTQEPFDRIWLPEDLGYDRAWIFQHNIMELCTAVKGRALCRLMDEDTADLYLYLDPDVYVFNDLEPIKDYMDGASIGLVPHILKAEETDIGVRLTEMSVTEHGIYNLGHLVVRDDTSGRAFANWWADRLDKYCFDDRTKGLFTDQRWVDLAPAIFDGVRVLRQSNLDVASWNLFGRKIEQNASGNLPTFTVDGAPLITYHFSGTGPNGQHKRIREIFDTGNGASAEIERIYEDAIASNGQEDLSTFTSAFDTFEDGKTITSNARTLFREHADLQRAFADPYSSDKTRLTFQSWLMKHRPMMIDGIMIQPHLLERAFIDLFDEDYYFDRNPGVRDDVANGEYKSAIDHYCLIGSALMLDPNEFFISSYYHRQAVKSMKVNPGTYKKTMHGTALWHYLSVGLPNGLEPIEFFDSRFYLEQNPDILNALRIGDISSPLSHFLKFGSREGRDPGPEFKNSKSSDSPQTSEGPKSHDDPSDRFGAFVRNGKIAGRVVA